MQLSSSLAVLLVSTLATLTAAQYADDHFIEARDAVANAEFEYLNARSDFEVLKRVSIHAKTFTPKVRSKDLN
jgi:hypothetical protein